MDCTKGGEIFAGVFVSEIPRLMSEVGAGVEPFSISKIFLLSAAQRRSCHTRNRQGFALINNFITLQHPAPMDREALSAALAINSAAIAARQFAVTPRTVYRWCKTLGISRRNYRCPDQRLLRRLESDGNFQKDIARTFGVSRWTIRRWCRKFGILHHTTGQFRKGTKGNIPAIHDEMPFGIGVLFEEERDGFNF